MLDRQQLEAFACVIEHKSFERAASALNITDGALSQRIKSLKNSLSTILIIRERPIHPRRQARLYYSTSRPCARLNMMFLSCSRTKAV